MAKTRKRANSTKAGLAVRADAELCRRCDLWRAATQAVFGAGPPRARIMFVGEQPGDVEDRAGEPFVGPAGQLLREAIGEAGLDLAGIYLTNAVKHFKWEPRGKRRIHKRPTEAESRACRVWLDAEIAFASSLAPLVTLTCTPRRFSAHPTHGRVRRRVPRSSRISVRSRLR